MNRFTPETAQFVKAGTELLYIPQTDECYPDLIISTNTTYAPYTVREIFNVTGELEVSLEEVTGHFPLQEFVRSSSYGDLFISAGYIGVDVNNGLVTGEVELSTTELSYMKLDTHLTVGRDVTVLNDGSAFYTESFPLPKEHWLYKGVEKPMVAMRMGSEVPLRHTMERYIRDALKYSLCVNTKNGTDMDFDPDALVTETIIALLGFYTPDGTSNTSDLVPSDESN